MKTISTTQHMISLSNSFECLCRDFLKLCEYIDPIDSNESCFSHRSYELLLRSCTELENLWCIILREKNYSKKGNWTIKDYCKIESEFGINLSSKEVTFVFWKPEPAQSYIKPFEGWTTTPQKGQPRLSWYNAYNEVKHDREQNFSKASLKNLRYAMSALYINLIEYYGCKIFTPSLIANGKERDQFSNSSLAYRDHIFQLKR